MDYITAYPKLSIIVISLIATLFSTLVTKWITNQEHLMSLKKRQKEIQKELKECAKKNDECKMKELQSEMMSITGVMFKSSFKPMFITLVPLLILIYWLRQIYSAPVGGGAALLSGWIGWYIGASIISSMILRKVLKMA